MNDSSDARLTAFQNDTPTIAAASTAHFASHFLQLALAPLLPLMREDLDVNYTQLGLLLSIIYMTSGVGQVLAGVFVDRWGPHRVLLAGLALQAMAVALMGFAQTFVLLLPLAFAAGLGNSVYHPADLSILSQRVSEGRLGRAFATHTIAGVVGFAVSPLFIGLIGSSFGWRPALHAAGCIALAIWCPLFLLRNALRTDGHKKRLKVRQASRTERQDGFLSAIRQFASLPIVLYAFLFFLLLAVSEQSIQNFGITALTEGYQSTLVVGTLTVTGYQACRVMGIAAGGVISDRTTRHHLVATSGLLSGAVFMLLLAIPDIPLGLVFASLALVGFASGMAMASRDVLVRLAAPAGSYGKVFGAVYSGLDAGSLIAPLIYGALLDRHLFQMVFVVGAVTLALSAFTVQAVRSQRHIAQRP